MSDEEKDEAIRKLTADRDQLRAWLRLALASMDRHVPIDQYPPELDAARDALSE